MIYLSKGGGPVPIRTIRGSAPGVSLVLIVDELPEKKKKGEFVGIV